MIRPALTVGDIALSTHGRDQGRETIVVRVLDADFVLTADGKLRTMEKPKKKRRKHLKPTGRRADAVAGKLAEGLPVADYELRACLSKEEG